MRRKATAILYLFCWLGYVTVSAQQKLYIDQKGYLSTDVVVYDANDNAHIFRALINTSSYVCSIDSSAFSSLNLGTTPKEDSYIEGAYGNYQKSKETIIPKLSLSGSIFEEIPTAVYNFGVNSTYKMVIGASILDGRAWAINQVDSTIQVVEKADKGYIADIMLYRGKKKQNARHFLLIPLKIEGQSILAVFNTGTNGIGLTKKIDGLDWTPEVFEETDYGPFHYNARHQEKLVDAHVEVSKWETVTTVKYVPMLAFNMVGNSLLSGYKYVLDYKKNRIYLY